MSHLRPLALGAFEAAVLKSSKPVVVDFGAPWCGPCKMLDPILAELAADYSGRVDFYSVDVDQQSQLAMDYRVMAVPTLILFKDGQSVKRLSGYRPKKALEKALLSDL